MNTKEFNKFMVNETPKFDQEIMNQIRPTSNWVGTVQYGRPDDHTMYLQTLESVRKISEGLAYKSPFSGCFKK